MKCFTLIKQSFLLPLIVCIIFCCGCIQTEYEYIKLLPPGWHRAFAEAINENGVVVGCGFDGTSTKGFIYQDGEYTELLPPGCEYATAEDINNNGVVVGFGYDGTTTKCFIYDNGEYTELLPPGWKSTGPTPSYVCINDSDVVVGSGSDGTAHKSFIYDNGEYTELLPPGWEYAEATGINNNGVIIGNGGNFQNEHMGFIYDNGEYTELLPPGWMDAFIFAINDNGAVGGSGNHNLPDTTISHTFIYRDGEYAELSDQMSVPSDINNNGMVIGFTYGPLGSWEHRSYVCKDSGECTELSPPGYMYTVCKSINDEGVVAGYAVSVYRGRFTRGPHGFIATPHIPPE